MKLVDSHCHLDLLDGSKDDTVLNAYLDRARTVGVCCFLNVCVDLQTFPTVLEIAKKYDDVFASVGVHPNEEQNNLTQSELETLASDEKVIAIGETGLDSYRSHGDLTWQHERFRMHIRAAIALKKPLIIHSRQAPEDTLRIMHEENASKVRGVMHCFSEDIHIAEQAIAMGFYISLSGNVTFKNALVTQEVAKRVPLDKLLIETDAPFLAPLPYRGKPNEPAYVHHTATFIASLRGITLNELANATTRNFFDLFTGAKESHV